MPIKIIEQGDMQSAVAGWSGSRTIEEAASAEQIARIDASVNELPSALFYFKDYMILERELFVTPRNHVIWARTSRVDDPRKFVAPEAFALRIHQAIREVMQESKAAGVHQDQWRLALPLCAQTSWTARLTFRDGVRMANYFADVAERIGRNNPQLADHLIMTSSDLCDALETAFGVTRDTMQTVLANFKRIKLPLVHDFGVGQTRKMFGAFVSMQMQMPIAMRAQLVRHREILIEDEFVDLLACVGSAEQVPISTPMIVQATALADTWHTVLGKRTCWMAQADLWAPLAALYGNGVDGLPCADGHCPYAEDAKQRVAGNDPGAPCPRYANLTRTPLNDTHWEAAMLEAKAKPNAKMWREELGVSTGY
jgi:hypothetical protein